MKRQEYKVGDTITWVNYNGEFKTIDEMSFKQRLIYNFQNAKNTLDYKIGRAKRQAKYNWKRELAANRDANDLNGSALLGAGAIVFLCNNEGGTLGGMIVGIAIASLGVVLIKARRKGGRLDRLVDFMEKFPENIKQR